MILKKQSYLPLQITSALSPRLQTITTTYQRVPVRSKLIPLYLHWWKCHCHPVFIKGVLNYSDLISELTKLIGLNSFICKSTSTHLKVQAKKPDDYRKLIHFLNEKEASFHIYQLQSDKPYRVVIRNLHPSTPAADISSAIEEIGFSTRQVTNIKHHQTKTALHTIVKVEEPHNRRDIPQCLNCQSYGHTRAYCSYTPRCVKCGEPHPISDCKKTPDTPATCALCFGNHSANYKGCTVHKELQNRHR